MGIVQQSENLMLSKKMIMVSSKYEKMLFMNVDGDLHLVGNPQLYNLECILSKRKEVFDDEENNKTLLPENYTNKWERIKEVYPGVNFNNGKYYFEYSRSEQNTSFSEAMLWLRNKDKILEEIFQISYRYNVVGIYRFFLFLSGNNAIEIVIDDKIPINYKNGYIFKEIRKDKFGALWPVLLEKSLAKLYGSYAKMHSMRAEEILSEITGYIDYRLLEKGLTFRMEKFEFKIEKEESKYFRIIAEKEFEAILGLWIWNKKESLDWRNLIIEIYETNDCEARQDYVEVELHKIYRENSMIVTKSTEKELNFTNPFTIIHIYNPLNQPVNFSVIGQSSEEMIVKTESASEEIEFKKYKKFALMNVFEKQIENENPFCFKCNLYSMYFKWFKHRGIFYFYNIKTKSLVFRIKKEFREEIFQEDINFCTNEVTEDDRYIFIIRKSEKEYGQFYEIIT